MSGFSIFNTRNRVLRPLSGKCAGRGGCSSPLCEAVGVETAPERPGGTSPSPAGCRFRPSAPTPGRPGTGLGHGARALHLPGPGALSGPDGLHPAGDDTTLRTGRELTPGTLPRPSISAEPGSVVPWGRPVSIVCRGPAGVRSFRLEKDNRYNYTEVAVTSRGEQETEARLHITALHKDAVGRYHCIYRIDSRWSELSEALSLEGTEEAVSALPTGGRTTGVAHTAPFPRSCPGQRMLAPEAVGEGTGESTEVNQELRGWDEEAPVKAAPDRQTPAPRQPTPPRTTRWRTGSAWAWLAWSC
ncbi:uncharacterized protein LOC122421220 [Cervus canadensis]|uniref:uncharacterized protein LOC122421220 n=1 Tax=Cervus canadensis TaxID=1574408 RepID=UPI001CA362B7|nr:uncharacterized protein LOC122421220 [Cervus canadensis]